MARGKAAIEAAQTQESGWPCRRRRQGAAREAAAGRLHRAFARVEELEATAEQLRQRIITLQAAEEQRSTAAAEAAVAAVAVVAVEAAVASETAARGVGGRTVGAAVGAESAVAAAIAARVGGGRGECAAVGDSTSPGGMGSALSISAPVHYNFDDIYDSPPSPGPHISSSYPGDSNPRSNTGTGATGSITPTNATHDAVPTSRTS